jgi:hypothetical protein
LAGFQTLNLLGASAPTPMPNAASRRILTKIGLHQGNEFRKMARAACGNEAANPNRKTQ